MMTTEVIIATRNDPDLGATVNSIRENSGCGVRVIEDRKGRGPQAVRHGGILASSADVVVIMDGHMRVRKGELDAAAEYVGNRGNKVACLRCYHSESEDWTGKPYAGATLQMTGYGKDENEPQAFVAKWRKSDNCGKIGAVMGACYVFRRDWYMDGLRSPWQWGRGWGCDEELLSAATWLRGGEVELLPWAVWHRAQSPRSRGFSYTREQLLGVWANRLHLLQLLPMPCVQRNDLVRHLISSGNHTDWGQAARMIDGHCRETEEYRAFLNAGGLSWAEFETQVIGKETVKMPSMMELREQARAAGITVPFGCKKVDLVKMLDGSPRLQAPEAKAAPVVTKAKNKPKTRANWGPDEKNNLGMRNCPHCAGQSSKVENVRYAGRLTIRTRVCCGCGKKFPTREVATV